MFTWRLSQKDMQRVDDVRTGLASDRETENQEVLIDLADLSLAKGDLDGAESQLQKVLASQPDHKRAKQLRGVILFRRGKLDEAQALLTEAMYLNPNPEQVHYYLGRICEEKGQQSKAIEHYREGLRHAINATEAEGTTMPSAPKK